MAIESQFWKMKKCVDLLPNNVNVLNTNKPYTLKWLGW